MMKNWQIFEANATTLLREVFNDTNLIFENTGGADSTVSDIKVKRNNTIITTIEAKYSPSQSGQIVLLLNNNRFEFSQASVNSSNEFVTAIIDFMNNDINTYINVGTSAIPIGINSQVLFNWVKRVYSEKGVEWVIASSLYNNLNTMNTALIPLNEIDSYFDISASFRLKQSGTSHLSMSRESDFKTHLDCITTNYHLEKQGKKYLLQLNENIGTNYISNEYFLSPTGEDNTFYVKKRGSTKNANVMFSLKLKDNIVFKSEQFKQEYYRQ